MEHRANFSTQGNKQEDRLTQHLSPSACGAILLCLYVVMYLAVAAVLHVVPTLSTAAAVVSTSLTDARRALAGEAPDRSPEAGGRLLARAARATIDINCD